MVVEIKVVLTVTAAGQWRDRVIGREVVETRMGIGLAETPRRVILLLQRALDYTSWTQVSSLWLTVLGVGKRVTCSSKALLPVAAFLVKLSPPCKRWLSLGGRWGWR